MDNNITVPMRIAQKKNGKTWVNTYTDIDGENVYRSLAGDVVRKKINNAGYIKSIKRVQRYSHVEIIVNYGNDNRSVYYLNALEF